MPKKFKGENSKAAEARARKEAKKEEAAAKKQREVEDELWRDDDKHVVKKQQRKVGQCSPQFYSHPVSLMHHIPM